MHEKFLSKVEEENLFKNYHFVKSGFSFVFGT